MKLELDFDGMFRHKCEVDRNINQYLILEKAEEISGIRLYNLKIYRGDREIDDDYCVEDGELLLVKWDLSKDDHPLHSAVFINLESIKRWLACGTSVDVRNEGLFTPFHLAIGDLGPNYEICNYLLSMGADINAKTIKGQTALHDAAQLVESEKVRYLLEKGADVTICDNEGKTAEELLDDPSLYYDLMGDDKESRADYEIRKRATSKVFEEHKGVKSQ